MNNAYEQTKDSVSNVANSVSQQANDTVNYIQQSVDNVTKNIDVTPNINATQEFLESNSIIAKFSFLIMAIFIFVILLKFSIQIISYFLFNKSGTVRFINGMIRGDEPIIFSQNPNKVTNGKFISKSDNATSGVEFTWSCWLYVNSITGTAGKYKHVFSKGNNNWAATSTGIASPNNAPGVYLNASKNELYVIISTYSNPNEMITVHEIPLNKWFNITICCVNQGLDIYVNGTIVNSHVLTTLPKQNYGDVFVCGNGGFSGNISNLVYYNKAISLQTIQQIISAGPNFKPVYGTDGKQKNYDYITLDWYLNNYGLTA